MFGITATQFWIGLAVLAGIILVIVTIVVIAAMRNPSVSHEGGMLQIPRSVKSPGDDSDVKILIPKGYTYEQMVILGEKLEKKVSADNYSPAFLRGFWGYAQACFIYQRLEDEEVKAAGPVMITFASMMDASPKDQRILYMRHLLSEGPKSSGNLHFVMMGKDELAEWIVHMNEQSEGAPITMSAPLEANTPSSYQSCGEGGCCCATSGFEPYSSLPPVGWASGYTPGGDLSDALLPIHQREGPVSHKSKARLTSQRMMIRDPKVVNTFSHYYAGLPRAERSLFISNPTNQDLRPAPPVMRLHQMGPYAENPTYYRPSQDRVHVMETTG